MDEFTPRFILKVWKNDWIRFNLIINRMQKIYYEIIWNKTLQTDYRIIWHFLVVFLYWMASPNRILRWAVAKLFLLFFCLVIAPTKVALQGQARLQSFIRPPLLYRWTFSGWINANNLSFRYKSKKNIDFRRG